MASVRVKDSRRLMHFKLTSEFLAFPSYARQYICKQAIIHGTKVGPGQGSKNDGLCERRGGCVVQNQRKDSAKGNLKAGKHFFRDLNSPSLKEARMWRKLSKDCRRL